MTMSQTPPQVHAELAAGSRLREDLIHPDPLLDCLVEVCRLQGHAASRASISAGLPLVGGRLNLELAEIALKWARFGDLKECGLKRPCVRRHHCCRTRIAILHQSRFQSPDLILGHAESGDEH